MQLHAIPIEVETLMCTDWMHNVRRTRWLAIVDAERRERLRIQLRCARVCNRFGRNKRFRARLGSRLDVDFESCVSSGLSRLRRRLGQPRSERSGYSMFDVGAIRRLACLRINFGFEVVRSVVDNRIDT